MALSLDDVLASPTDPDLLRRHLTNLGVLTPPIAPHPDSVATMTPPNLAPTNVPIPFRRPETPETPYPKDSFTKPHLPAMKSSEMPEAPVMSAPAAPPDSSMVAPMKPPVLSPDQQQQLPMTSPGSPTLGVPFYEQQVERALAHQPDKLSDHPSFLGKVGHVLGRVGNIAGDVFDPAAMSLIPGTDLYNRATLTRAERNLEAAKKGESEEELRKAQEREAGARADFSEAEARKLGQAGKVGLLQDANGNLAGWTDENGGLHSINEDATPPAIKEIAKNWEGKTAKAGGHENLEQGLAGAVADVIAKGGNPATDPAVKAWGDAIQQYKPSKTADVKTAEDLKQRIATAVEKGDLAEVKRLQSELEQTDPEGMARIRDAQASAAEHVANANQTRSDKSFQFNKNELEKHAKPVEDTMARFTRLEEGLRQGTPQADALIAPELLSIMAGGAGSGLRMNEAEISRIVGGRSHWQDLQAAVNKWSLDPTKANSITPEQRKEIRSLVSAVGVRLRQKNAAVDDARSALLGSDDPKEHRKVVTDLERKLNSIDANAGGEGGQKVKIGGKEYEVDASGQIEVNGVKYQTTPGSKNVTRVK